MASAGQCTNVIMAVGCGYKSCFHYNAYAYLIQTDYEYISVPTDMLESDNVRMVLRGVI